MKIRIFKIIHCVCALWNSVYISNSFCFICLGPCGFVSTDNFTLCKQVPVNNATDAIVTWDMHTASIMKYHHTALQGECPSKEERRGQVLVRRARNSTRTGDMKQHDHFGKPIGFTKAGQYTPQQVSSTLRAQLPWTFLYVSYSKYVCIHMYKNTRNGFSHNALNWKPKFPSTIQLINFGIVQQTDTRMNKLQLSTHHGWTLQLLRLMKEKRTH